MPALYRQYRPLTFSEVIGQSHITSVLEQQILQEKIAHAYLFQGPRGTGKTTTARIFAKRLNCNASKTAEPCGACEACIAFQEKRSMDVLEIDAASNRGIDDIRALRETASLAPTNGTYKIYIIDEVHMLSAPAFAALLKTLEEPPKHVIFILATTELHKVPATIASRCQLFRFRRATDEEIKERLTHVLSQEKRSADDDLLAFIASRSDGCYRDAESLLGQMLSAKEKTVTLREASDLLGVPSGELIESFLLALVEGDAKQAVTVATKAYNDGFDPDQFLQEAVRVARDGAIKHITESSPPAFATAPNAIDRITIIMRAFLVALQDISYVPEPMIAIELAILTVCASRGAAPAPQRAQAAPAAIPKTPAMTPATPAPVPVPTPALSLETPKQEIPTTQAVSQQPASDNAASLTKIQSSWEAIIQAVRKNNPVASTFLRATEPANLREGLLTLQMHFPLHKTFFDKADNMQLVKQAIFDTVQETVAITCILATASANPSAVREQKQSQEESHLKNIQEVFGVHAA